MRQRYAYGSNIAAVRCGWDVKIKEQWRIKDCRIQSGAVLWLRHSFARAFSGDSALFSLPCGGGKGVGCHVERQRNILSLRASVTSVATNRQGILMILYTVDCFGCRLAMTKNGACKIFYCHVERSETSLSVIARGASLVAIKRVKSSKTFDCFADARNDTRTRHCERA